MCTDWPTPYSGAPGVRHVLTINFLLGASIWGLLSAVMINLTTHWRSIGAHAAIGIVTTSSFALGVALMSRNRNFTRDFGAAPSGRILGIEQTDLFAIVAVSMVAGAALFAAFKHLLFTTFEPEVVRSCGVPTG